MTAWGELIEAADVVSFDVFDTLLVRKVLMPTDVFLWMERREGIPGFRNQRVAAEEAARARGREKQHRDITLDEIYRELGHPRANELKQAEIDAEHACCVAHPAGVALVDQARAAGKAVIAVSDMYLPPQVVDSLLRNAGIEVDRVWVSAHTPQRATKWDGSLFELVAAELGKAPHQFVHFGDNALSDSHAALGRGWVGVHVPALRDGLEDPTHPFHGIARRPWRDPLARSLHLGICLWRNAHADQGYWHRFGLCHAGLPAFGFADWIRRQARADGVQRLFFLARDGYVVERIYRLFTDAVPGSYLLASRRLFLVPSLADPETDVVTTLVTALPHTPAREYLTRLDLDTPELHRAMDAWFDDPDQPLPPEQIDRVKEFFRAHEDLIRQRAREEGQLLERHLEEAGFLEAVDHSALVDIGWGASSHRALETWAGKERVWRGYYFGLRREAHRNDRMRGYAFHYARPGRRYQAVSKSIEIYEWLFSAPSLTVMRFVEEDGALRPVFVPDNAHESLRRHDTRELQRGILEFAEAFAPMWEGLPAEVEADDALLPVDEIVTHPRREDLDRIGGLYHANGMGASSYQPLLPRYALNRKRLLAGRLHPFFTTFTYWPIGVYRMAGGRGKWAATAAGAFALRMAMLVPELGLSDTRNPLTWLRRAGAIGFHVVGNRLIGIPWLRRPVQALKRKLGRA